jgi:hypothetical protein
MDTLRRWLEINLGIKFPYVTRGSKHLLTDAPKRATGFALKRCKARFAFLGEKGAP